MALRDDIINVLTEFGMETVPDLQTNLQKKLSAKSARYGTRGQNKSRLSASIKFSFPKKTSNISFVLSMNEYGLILDSGRSSGGVESNAKIEEWANRYGVTESFRKKDLQSRLEQQGKNKTKRKKKTLKKMPFERASKQIGFLVRRKLKEKGYDGNHFFSEIIKDGRVEFLKEKLSALIKKDVRIEILQAIE